MKHTSNFFGDMYEHYFDVTYLTTLVTCMNETALVTWWHVNYFDYFVECPSATLITNILKLF